MEPNIHPIWTNCQIPKWQVPADLEAETNIAFENRSDLDGLHKLTSVSNDQILETLRSSVRSASPLAGLVLKRRLFGGFFKDNSSEIAKLRSQLMVLHAAQNDLVKSQITEQFYAVFKNHEQVHLKLQKLDSLRKSQARLEAKRQVGPISVEAVLTIKSETLKCRSEVVRAVVELQMSWIRLKSAQGLLGNLQQPLQPIRNGDTSQMQPRQDEQIERIGRTPRTSPHHSPSMIIRAGRVRTRPPNLYGSPIPQRHLTRISTESINR